MTHIDTGREAVGADNVQWVVNDLAELGVKIGNQFFFLYKGRSLQYGALDHDPSTPPTHEDDNPKAGYRAGDVMKWRPVFKREFGECCHPINHNDYSMIGTVSLDDSSEWRDIPPAASPKDSERDAAVARAEAAEVALTAANEDADRLAEALKWLLSVDYDSDDHDAAIMKAGEFARLHEARKGNIK